MREKSVRNFFQRAIESDTRTGERVIEHAGMHEREFDQEWKRDKAACEAITKETMEAIANGHIEDWSDIIDAFVVPGDEDLAYSWID